MSSSDELDRLTNEAARSDYASMVRLARALYDSGADNRGVIRRCYGFDLPEEFFGIANDDAFFDSDHEDNGLYSTPLSLTNQPWQLAIPPAKGGPDPEPDGLLKYELKAYEIDSDLLPLEVRPEGTDVIRCYRISELRAGRTTIVDLRVDPGGAATFSDVADSYLATIQARFRRGLDSLEREYHQPYNVGAGSVDDDEVDHARKWVERVENLRRATST